jgi:hypothetical protein
VERRLVIEGDLFARLDIAESDEEDMSIKYFHVAVRFARMVDVVSAVSAFAPIQAPALINGTNAESATPGAAVRFCVSDSLAGIFCYLSTAEKVRLGKTTLAFDS